MLTPIMENGLDHRSTVSRSKFEHGRVRIVLGQQAIFNIRELFESFASLYRLTLEYRGVNTTFLTAGNKAELLQLLFDWLHHSVANLARGAGLAVEIETGKGDDSRMLARCRVECRGAGIMPVRLSKLFHRFCRDEAERVNRSRLSTGHHFSRTTFFLEGGTIEVDTRLSTPEGEPVTRLALVIWQQASRPGIREVRQKLTQHRYLKRPPRIMVEQHNTNDCDDHSENMSDETRTSNEVHKRFEADASRKGTAGCHIDGDERRLRYNRIVNVNAPANTAKSADEQFLEKLMSLLEEHVADPDFNVSKLVTVIGMSRPVLFRKAKVLTGSSIINLIRTRRLKLAEALLRQKNVAVSEVAFRVGYTDPKYFSKSFRNHYGKTPREYAHGK